MSKLNHTGNKNVQKRKPQCYVRKKSQLNCSFSHQLKTTCLITSFLFQSIAPSYANIIADNQAPQNQQPIILKDGQGNPLINIQTPNTNGLSHNRYMQFDVDTHGATLNNHRTSNPHLAKGTAKVILNEVRSNSPSKLEGIVSVIGDKADVIIANPSGIQVNGGGFKNVGRSTLTTGQIEVKNGAVQAIDVQQGTVSIGSKGFDNRETDYTEILARAVEVQGALQANQVGISTANQKVDYVSGQVLEKREGASTSEVAIDIAELGGIYANSIHLIANENGVGVKNSGQLKANNRLVVTSSGRIENVGEMLAQHDSDKSILVLETVGKNQDIVSTKGKIEGKNQVILSASGKVKLANTKVQQTDKNAGTGVLLNSKANIEITESQLTSGKGNVSLLSKNDIQLANNTSISADNDLFLRSQDGKIQLDTLFETKTETSVRYEKRRGNFARIFAR
ncbi:TPA: filamentous hemagglutinin N-terminal domain-containing protein, partial [Pasteurella multocida]|nr:filamentous hemagglutinin N-terminal domain-containing protein [Pasteurella multocida]